MPQAPKFRKTARGKNPCHFETILYNQEIKWERRKALQLRFVAKKIYGTEKIPNLLCIW